MNKNLEAVVENPVTRTVSRVGKSIMAGVALVSVLGSGAHTWSQDKDYLIPYEPEQLDEYNLKYRDIKVDLSGQIGGSFSDNVNYSEANKIDDFSYLGGANIRAYYQPSRVAAINFDLFLGYQGYIDTDELNSLVIRPGSEFRIERRIGQIKVGFYDQVGVELDPTRKAYISGDAATLGGNAALEWRRIYNTAGFGLTWQPTRAFHTESAYEFKLDRSLSDTFKSLDNDNHVFKSGAYYDFSRFIGAGIEGEYGIRDYTDRNLANSQNDSDSFDVGPVVTIRPDEFTDIEVKAYYSEIDYSSTGAIADTENFEGLTFSAELKNRPMRNFTHQIGAYKTVDDGFGTNFAEQTSVGYGLTSEFARGVLGMIETRYVWLETSGGVFAEDANLFSINASVTKQLTKKSHVTISYGYFNKDSELAGRDYQQNLISVLINYDF